MKWPQIDSIRKYLKRNDLDPVEVLAVLLRTMMAEHLLLYRRLDSGMLPDVVVEAIDAAQAQAEADCEHPAAVTILESTLEALKRYEQPQQNREMRELPLTAPPQTEEAAKALADHLYVLHDEVRDLIAGCVDKADEMHEADKPA